MSAGAYLVDHSRVVVVGGVECYGLRSVERHGDRLERRADLVRLGLLDG